MATEYDLSPKDGISNYWVSFDGLDVVRSDPRRAVIRFRMFTQEGGRTEDLCQLKFKMEPGKGGVRDMIARTHDELVAALRQMLYAADTMRRVYKSEVPEAPQPGST